LKKCSSCGSLLPVTAFSRATKSRDGRAAVCRRCADVNRQSAKRSRGKNEIRDAIKEGNIQKVRDLLSGAPFATNQLLAMAVQNYNTARKHDGHSEIVDFLIGKGAKISSFAFSEALAGEQGHAKLSTHCAPPDPTQRLRLVRRNHAGDS
jgi:hypothetical protein